MILIGNGIGGVACIWESKAALSRASIFLRIPCAIPIRLLCIDVGLGVAVS